MKARFSILTGIFLMVLLLIPNGKLYACIEDRDCPQGSTCEKSEGRMYGTCSGGGFVARTGDRAPDPFETGGGRECRFDSDCSGGSRCSKEGGHIFGSCQ